DNLKTHVPGAFYETFPPERARALLNRLEIHYTPKHGSWLNIAELELSALKRQCLQRRIPTIEILREETESWNRHRNQAQKGVDWQFTTTDARVKLKRLYPMILEN
ncbi:MAG: transposase, partial [Methanomicrobiaceae archaeon]|nr:transposase [Methanomicrobiaceae archaeon]